MDLNARPPPLLKYPSKILSLARFAAGASRVKAGTQF